MPYTETEVKALATEDLIKFIDDVVFEEGTTEEGWAMQELLDRIIPATETSAVVESDNRGGVRPRKPNL